MIWWKAYWAVMDLGEWMIFLSTTWCAMNWWTAYGAVPTAASDVRCTLFDIRYQACVISQRNEDRVEWSMLCGLEAGVLTGCYCWLVSGLSSALYLWHWFDLEPKTHVCLRQHGCNQAKTGGTFLLLLFSGYRLSSVDDVHSVLRQILNTTRDILKLFLLKSVPGLVLLLSFKLGFGFYLPPFSYC